MDKPGKFQLVITNPHVYINLFQCGTTQPQNWPSFALHFCRTVLFFPSPSWILMSKLLFLMFVVTLTQLYGTWREFAKIFIVFNLFHDVLSIWRHKQCFSLSNMLICIIGHLTAHAALSVIDLASIIYLNKCVSSRRFTAKEMI